MKAFRKTISLVFIFVLFVYTGSALATQAVQDMFTSAYPITLDSVLTSCKTCHVPAKPDSFLNPYGEAVRTALQAVNLTPEEGQPPVYMDFVSFEQVDSDEDGVLNINEINNLSLPGSQATRPDFFIFNIPEEARMMSGTSVEFDHLLHSKDTTHLSGGRCDSCHGEGKFPRFFNDLETLVDDPEARRPTPIAHTVCLSCHRSSDHDNAPTSCRDCHKEEE